MDQRQTECSEFLFNFFLSSFYRFFFVSIFITILLQYSVVRWIYLRFSEFESKWKTIETEKSWQNQIL